MTFAVRAAGEHLARLSLLTLVVTLVIAGIGGIDAAAERMLTTGASRILADAEPAARTIRVQALEAEDGMAQDATVRDAIATAFAGTDVIVSRWAALDESALTATGEAFTIRLLDDPRVPELATLTDGDWPRSPTHIALPVAAAERQQLDVGDIVTLPESMTGLTVVGTWTADDVTDPAWHGDPSVASGESDGVIGPAIVAEGALSRIPDTATVSWGIAPMSTAPAEIPELQRALTALRTLPDTLDPQRQHSTRVLGELGETLQRQTSALAATRGLLVAPLLVIMLLGGPVLGSVLTTLCTSRGEELALLRARGASRRRLAFGAAAEAATFAVAGAAIALALLCLIVDLTATALLTAAGAVVFTAVAAGLLTARSAVRVASGAALRSDAGARTIAALILPAGIATGLAALSTWQLLATRTVVRADGAADPLAASAPALLLIAACALAPVAAAPIAALGERLLRSTRGLAPILPLRQTARRMGGVAVAIVCLALAAASVALAAAAPAVADAAEHRTRIALLGGDVRMLSDDALDVSASTAATWPGVTGAAEVLRTPLAAGSDTAVLVAGPPEALGLDERIVSADGPTIAAGVTRSLADRLGADVGTVFTARIRGFARPVPFEVTRILDALPGVGGWGVAVDPEELRSTGAELPPNELWLRSSTPEATAARLRAHATHPVRILTAAEVSDAPVTSAAPVLLAVGALIAAALGVTGFLAASSASHRIRRGEAFALRALGLRPSHQRALRAGETATVAAYAVAFGAVLGAGIAAAVLPIILGVGA